MQSSTIINGRMTGPTSIELDEPVMDLHGEVEVILRPRSAVKPQGETMTELLERLPPGTRTREEIDRQIREEQDSWEDRN